jgi:surfactin family lipopeptide synthetase C
MVPSVMVELESMPLTFNGKIDEGRLPKRGHAEASEEEGEPGNAVEEVLLGIWAEVLKLDTITVHDNFFDCGGHSLLSVLLVSRIREALQTDLPLRTIFEAPTVRRLAGKMLVDPSEARRIDAVARMFLHFLDMQDQEEEEGSLSGTEEAAR